MKELVFGLIGGTALLMYGVDKMGEGLEKASGEMMKKILSVLTGRVWSAFLVGTFLTALVQSSTAITVLTVGFVNAGLMKLPQAVGIIYGANIGTTITAQFMAMSFHFKLTDVALPILGIGFTISYFGKGKTKNVGDALMGFGMMFLGLKILNSGVPIMQSSPTMRYFFEKYASVPLIGILLGVVATALVHSSAATVGLTMVLGQAGLLDLKSAICIMLGDNIGTCITAQLASLTGNIHARRTAWAHTLYNIFGVVVTACVLPWFVKVVNITTQYLTPSGGIAAEIANSHTMFNVLSAVVFLPITRYYVRFLELVIRGKDDEDTGEPVYLDELLLDTPVAAGKAALSEISRAAVIARQMVERAFQALYSGNLQVVESLPSDEEKINRLQRDITRYIVGLSKRPLTQAQSAMVPALIASIDNIERIGDHAQSLLDLVHTKVEGGLVFSDEAIVGLKELQTKVMGMFDRLIAMMQQNEFSGATELISDENEVDELSKKLLQAHIRRLEEGKCRVESGVIFLDIVNYLERIADHICKVSNSCADGFAGLAQ